MRNIRAGCIGVRGRLSTPALSFALVSLLLASPAAGALVELTPAAIENGRLYYEYYGNGNSGSGYEPLTTTELKASNSYSTLATHSYSSYRIFSIEFDLSGIAAGSVVKSATLSVDETITNYTGKLRLYSTTGDIGFSTFSGSPISDRTVAIQPATPTTFEFTSILQSAVNSGAGHLSIGMRNAGGASAPIKFGGIVVGHFWNSSVATWSNPQLSLIVVPEPSSCAMLLAGAALVLLFVCSRRSAARSITSRP